MAMTTAEADKILSVGFALRALTPGLRAELVDEHRRFGVLPGQERRHGKSGGLRDRCRRRPRTRPPGSPRRPFTGTRKQEDDMPADFVPVRGDRFGCPEPSGTAGARPPNGVRQPVHALCASRTGTRRPTRPVADRRRSVRSRGPNPRFRESAHRMPKRVTASRGSAQLPGARAAFGAGVSDSPLERRKLIRADPARGVKKSPTSSGRACTVSCSRDTSSQVNAVIDWLRRPWTCFDPTHRRVIAVSRKRGARCPCSRPSSVPRGGRSPLMRYPCEGKFHHELHPPG